MKDKINSIDMEGKLDHEEIYNLFKTYSSKINEEISEKIDKFQDNMDFFGFYSNTDIKNFLKVFEKKITENTSDFYSSFHSNIDQYLSCISQIILSIKLLLKINDVLTKIFNNAKNQLSKLKYENEIENYNEDYLVSYLESLLKISEKSIKSDSRPSTLLSSNISSIEDTPKNSLFSKYSSEYKINDLTIDEIESNIYDNLKTPRFESESDEESENKERTNSNLENSIDSSSYIKKDSALTLSKYVFDEKPYTPKNLESKLIDSPIAKQRIKNSSTKGKMPQIERVGKHKNSKNASPNSCLINKNNNKNRYKNLLEMINKMYKIGVVNSEEKIKLKQLVIGKSKKIEYLYYNIYSNSKNNKDELEIEVKKILNSL